jgi:hypothetical protein
MRWRRVRALGLAVAVVAAVGTASSAAEPRPRAATTPKCMYPSGYADWNDAPSSVSDLIEQSVAVVTVLVTGKEKPVSSQNTGGSTLFLMRSKTHVENVFKGDVEAMTNIDIHRSVIGHDLDGALAQSVCMVGETQALLAGSRYMIGLVRDQDGRWYAAAGPYSTIPFRVRGDRLVALANCPVAVTDCEQFPYTLAGRTYATLKAEAKAAAR